MTLSRTAYVNLLRAQTGYREGRDPGGNWNNHQKFSPQTAGLEWSQDQAWCHTFGSWGADELGDRGALPITASCLTGATWFKSRSRWTAYPVLGGLFYMGANGGAHVGVVYAYDADYIYTVEGNTNDSGSPQGNGVYELKRPRRGTGSPHGYGIPYFAEKTVSADPALGGTVKAAVPVHEEEDDMALTQSDIDKILTAPITLPNGKKVALATILAWTDNRHNVIHGELEEVKATLAKIMAKLS